MATTYTSKIDLRCWKEHTCIGCNAAYAYELIRQIKGTGSTAAAAEASAKVAVHRAVERDTDLEPCPTCGLYQPDMIGQRKASKNLAVFWLALIAFAIILIVCGANGLQADLVTWVAVIAGGAAGICLLRIDLGNPNVSLNENIVHAQKRVAAAKLRSAKAGQPHALREDPVRTGQPLVHNALLLIVLLAVAALAAPEGIRMARGWPTNAGCYPPVVGPGDSTRIYFSEKISSVKGFWRGKAVAQLLDLQNPSRPGIMLQATANQKDWGSSISVKRSEKDVSSTPWVSIEVPANEELAGKTRTCDIQLDLAYPYMGSGSYMFTTKRQTLEHRQTLKLGPTGSGAAYSMLWWNATAGGMLAILICALLLYYQAQALRRQAKPTRSYV